MYCIYRIRNKINNKTYIGQHKYKDLSVDTYMGSGKYLWSAYNKYGIENFEREIVVSEIESKEEIDKLERKYIKLEREARHGEYNISNGGEKGWPVLSGKNHPMYGKHLSEKAKKKVSETQKGNTHFLGKHHSTETKKKISEALKGNKSFMGKHLSEEHKKKISEAHKGITFSEDARNKLSESQKLSRLGKRLYNNGIECHMYIPGTEPEGYVLGKLF